MADNDRAMYLMFCRDEINWRRWRCHPLVKTVTIWEAADYLIHYYGSLTSCLDIFWTRSSSFRKICVPLISCNNGMFTRKLLLWCLWEKLYRSNLHDRFVSKGRTFIHEYVQNHITVLWNSWDTIVTQSTPSNHRWFSFCDRNGRFLFMAYVRLLKSIAKDRAQLGYGIFWNVFDKEIAEKWYDSLVSLETLWTVFAQVNRNAECLKIKARKHGRIWKTGFNVEHMHISNWTGPDSRISKPSLLTNNMHMFYWNLGIW